jgi:hypothetical protein
MTNDTRSAPPGTRAGRMRPGSERHPSRRADGWRRGWLAGGTEGNERLTILTGLLLIVLLAVLGVTIIRIGQLLWLHLFLGLVLLGPVALKLASTGYRFLRYYTSDEAYRRKGPPAPALRGLAPLVISFTLAVFATGVALLLLGPSSRGPLVLLHKISFFAWIAVTVLHVLGHLPEIVRLLQTARRSRSEMLAINTSHSAWGTKPANMSPPVPGGRGRGGAMAAALISGLVIAVALLGQFSAWTH